MKNRIVIDGIIYTPELPSGEFPYVIVRTYSAGVFCGNLFKKDGFEVILNNCRRLWRWDSKFTLSELSVSGVRNSNECKFSCETQNHLLLQPIEIMYCTTEAEKSLKLVNDYVP